MHNDLNQQSNVAIVYQSLNEVHVLLSALEAQSKSGSLSQRDRDTAEAIPSENCSQQWEHYVTPAVLDAASLWVDEFNASGNCD